MKILYYITSHGYGHAVRSAAICNSLGKALPNIGITVKSAVPSRFFEEELTVSHRVIDYGFDIGCLQKDGVTTLVEETLKAYSDKAASNALLLDGEARWCADFGFDRIIGDITPFAFAVANRAKIPSVAISNFTWHDIYLPYIERFPQYAHILSEMALQYGYASTALALYPASPMTVFKNKKTMPIIGQKGRCRRKEIYAAFGIDGNKRLGLIYAGNFGLNSVNWRQLESFKEWEFVGVYPLAGNPKNFHIVTKELFKYRDLSASVDAIIAKLGYGVFSESLLNGVPLIYLPREDFSEFEILHASARQIGNGTCIDAETFAKVNWEKTLNAAVDNHNVATVNDDGADMCAKEILTLCG